MAQVGDWEQKIDQALAGMGYELVDFERASRGLVRVLMDSPKGISVEDCEKVSHHLTRWFEVEGLAYERLEVSSPGLDRPLKKAADFERFAGEQAQIKMRMPINNQRNFIGVLRGVKDNKVQLETETGLVALELNNLDKARLIPNI
ncbi:MAG: ribosome maturation factor RimP [Burkholderiales bacterium]